MAASSTGRTGARIAVYPGSSAPGISAAPLKGDLLLLPENLDFRGREAKRRVRNRGGWHGHLVPEGTCSNG